MSSKSVPWTMEMISRLIELFEGSPCLYNVKDSSYHDRDKKRKAISEIAIALGIKDDDVTKKIKNIRTQYVRERQKVKKRKSGEGTDELYTSKWPHYNSLKFLDEFVTAKKTITNLEVSGSEIDNEDGNEEQEEFQEDDVSEVHSTKRPIKETRPKLSKHKCEAQEEMLLEKAVSMMVSSPVTTQEEDDDYVFGRFIANEIRTITDPQVKRSVKWKIQSAIFFANSGPFTQQFQGSGPSWGQGQTFQSSTPVSPAPSHVSSNSSFTYDYSMQ